MTALSMPILPSDTFTPLEMACEIVVHTNREISRLYEKIEALRQKQRIPLQMIDQDLATDLRAKGAKSKRVGDYIVSTGWNTVDVCACHGALRSDCNALGAVEMIGLQAEPWVRVKEVE